MRVSSEFNSWANNFSTLITDVPAQYELTVADGATIKSGWSVSPAQQTVSATVLNERPPTLATPRQHVLGVDMQPAAGQVVFDCRFKDP